MKRLILIDGNALVHRAFHALPPLNSPKGIMTNAVFGFTSVLFKMFKELKPDLVVATFDLAGKTFRHEEFEDYKIHRQKAPDELYAQIPLIKEILRSMGIPIFEKAGFEADDLIGSITERAKKNKDLQVVIVTGDLDTLQLVEDDKVVVFTLKKGITDTFTYNEKEVIKRYGLLPNQVTDFKGLKGDPSDNIPGVPGVGDKTASDLLKKYKTIDNLYKEIDKMSKEQSTKQKIKDKKAKPVKPPIAEKLLAKLIEFKDQAIFSKRLATILTDVDIDFDLDKTDWRKHTNKEELNRLLKDFGFASLIKRLSEVYGEDGSAGLQGSLEFGNTDDDENLVVKSEANLSDIKGLLTRDSFAFDIYNDSLFLALDDKKIVKLDIKDVFSSDNNEDMARCLIEAFESSEIKKIGHDLKESAKYLMKRGVNISGLGFDTKLASYLINPDLKDYDIFKIYYYEFNKQISDIGDSRINLILEIKDRLMKKLEVNKLDWLFDNVEMPLVTVLARMELAGIKIDREALDSLSRLVNKEIGTLEKTIYKEAGSEFNINSPQQLSEILFDKLGLKGRVKKTGTGARSTAASELEKLVGEHKIIESILRYRELQKLKTTYIEPFPSLLDSNSRVHTNYDQTGAATGRLSSKDPNLQNIPARTEIGQEFRKTFIASPGSKLISFDYSQLELRIAAHISEDPTMIMAFKNGEDIHTRTAAEIFNVKPGEVTDNMRRQAKVLNFGILYGMGILGFQRASGVDRERARDFIDRYMEEFSGVALYMNKMKAKAHKDGFVETIFGRKRYLTDIKSTMPQLISQAERIAINMPIQGTASDLIKISMVRVQNLLENKYKKGEIKMLLQVHDELLFEVKNNLVQDIVPQIKDIMNSAFELKVPLVTEAKYGDNWRDMEYV